MTDKSSRRAVYANVIIDISHEKVDRPFQYRIPEALEGQVRAGQQVLIPFGRGNTLRKGYVVELTGCPEYDVDKIKEIAGIPNASVTVESRLIRLAWWIRETYGGTMNQALKTVLPVKRQVKKKENRVIIALADRQTLQNEQERCRRKHYTARARLLESLVQTPRLPYELAARQLNATASVLKPLQNQGLIRIDTQVAYRNPVSSHPACDARVELNSQQQRIADVFCEEYDAGKRDTYLIHGITGSGKTEVYMEMIDCVLRHGREVILLIPEIALTYQTVLRFYSRFGDIVSVVNSRLSAGERSDQFERARNGEVRIMIGPRSALFTPFANLGLILIDEEHEGAYKSEGIPRYHAREVARQMARMQDLSLVLGSATPSLEAYSRAKNGEYRLFTMTRRAKPSSRLSKTEVVDLREELKSGNKSIFSRRLHQEIRRRLSAGEQVMLFMNRRGYSHFVSCRSCGEAVKCGHCDVSMTLHNSGELICHYCGSRMPMPKACPSCGSPYIAAFGAGTQKLEELAKKEFPSARVLRMDLDTTSRKGGHEEILRAFAEGEADILIGTQMIVKGHDFSNVTLVGIMAADQSLHAPDYRCAERTFQLLTQAAGRAGRDEKPGEVIIQTYSPDHYSIRMAAAQDYEGFYEQEMAFRRLLGYPPAVHLLTVQLSSADEGLLEQGCRRAVKLLESLEWYGNLAVIGPVSASIYKVNDIYRKILYIKNPNYDILISTKNKLEESAKTEFSGEAVHIQYDFS